MSEIVEVVSPVCPKPSVHARRSLARQFIDIVATSAFLIASALLAWTLFAIRMHRIILSRGDFGSYGIIELPQQLRRDVLVVDFSVVRVPSRVVHIGSWMRWPVPEVLEVSVSYQEPDGRIRHWEKTYLLTCDSKGACEPLSALRGVILFGCCGSDGGLVERGWVYFPDTRPPQERAVPGPPNRHVLPQKPPSRTLPPGATLAQSRTLPVHKAGSFFAQSGVEWESWHVLLSTVSVASGGRSLNWR